MKIRGPIFGAALCLATIVQGAERESFHDEAFNIKLHHDKSWKRSEIPGQENLLTLERAGNVIVVSAWEVNTTPESIQSAYEDEQGGVGVEGFKRVEANGLQVGGVRAIRAVYKLSRDGTHAKVILVAFTRQGIAYRLLGVEVIRLVRVEQEIQEILNSVTFLRDRPKWIARFEGKPRSAAMVGGLVTFEINRPRWKETLPERDYRIHESVGYEFLASGAWANIHARTANGSAGAELEAAAHFLRSFYAKTVVEQKVCAGKEGNLPYLEIRTEGEPFDRVLRVAAWVKGEVAVWAWLECLLPWHEEVLKDWEQLAHSLRLRDPQTAQDLAYPLAIGEEKEQEAPALAAWQSKGRREMPGDLASGLQAIDPSGARALMNDQDSMYLIDFKGGARTALDVKAEEVTSTVWSREGRHILMTTGAELAVYALEDGQTRRFPCQAGEAVFGATQDEAIVVERLQTTLSDPRFASTRLVRLGLSDGSRQELVAFPLSKLGLPRLSPDGQSLAFVSNLHLPRTDLSARNLFVASADGSNPRRLTEGLEAWQALAWAPDGSALYGVKGFGGGTEYYAARQYDLFRIPLDGGPARNLTASQFINGVWCAGEDLLVRLNEWGAPKDQCGLFRVPAAALTGRLDAAQKEDKKSLAERIGKHVQEALNAGDPDKLKPDAALMARAAEALAAGLREAAGLEMDFSFASLDALYNLDGYLGDDAGLNRLVVLACGAYYGEVLRREAGAEWEIENAPLGRWMPGTNVEANPYAEVLLPLTDTFLSSIGSDSHWLWNEATVRNRDPGQRLLLVYPPTHAKKALKKATGGAYRKAHEKLDEGNVAEALEELAKELQRRPNNSTLAVETIALCQATGSPEEARALTRRVVEAGCEVPSLLVEFADALVKDEPLKALAHYRKAVLTRWPQGEHLLKLGNCYAAMERRDLAEACWRRAYHHVYDEQKKAEIVNLLGIGKEDQEGE